MAQLNSLIVTGNSRFLNPINGNARNGIYYVKGTQTAATGAWTGVIPIPALYDGLTIMYYLPYAPSGNATLNLTLSTGATTGAINCYYSTSRLTTHYGKGSNIVMTYHPAGSISVDGTATTDNRWIANANYADGNNTYVLTNYYNRFKAGANKVFPYTIIMQCSDGRWESIVTSSSTGTSKARNTHGFRLGQIALMYANATYNEDATIGDNTIYEEKSDLIDHRYSFNTANNSTSGTTAVKPIYLVGALNASNGLFYLDTTWWTQTLPSTEDGKLYIYLGDAYDYYRMTFRIHHPVYHYSNGAIREYVQDAGTVTGHTVAKDVPSNAEFTDTQSDWNATSGKAVILNKPTIPTVNNATLTIQKNGTTVKTFTANASSNVTANITVPTAGDSATTGISIADHTTGTITGVQSSTTTASKVTLGTAISVPNVTSAGSASTWAFENITVPKAATSATSIPNVTAVGSGSFTATVTNGVLSFSHVHTAPTLGTAISVTGVSGSTTASHVKSGGNGTAPTLGTAISIPNVTGATDVTVPIKNTSATTVVTSKTHTVTDNGHTHTLS